jgi:hypothetical protein
MISYNNKLFGDKGAYALIMIIINYIPKI